MNYRTGLAVPLALSLSLALAADGRAQVAAGGEFRVNTYTTNSQRWPDLTARANGDFVVVWHSDGPDGSGFGVRSQRYTAAGAPVGGEFQVNTYTMDFQYRPRIQSNAKGVYVVTWSSFGQDGSDWAAMGRKFNADGTPAGPEFRANTYTIGYQYLPSPHVAANGSFVVVWDSFYPGQDGSGGGVIGRRYDASGAAIGGEFQINTYTTQYQAFAAVDGTPAGSFVVAWQSPQDGDGYGIVARRYDASGNAVGAEFVVNSSTTGDQLVPSVAVNPSGSFVVTWMSPEGAGGNYGVRARRFDAAGNAVGAEFAVNSYTTGVQYSYSVANDDAGNFVVAWASQLGDGNSYGVFGQRFTAAGARRGAEFRINTYTTDVQSEVQVTSDAVGNFDVAWRSFGQDGSLSGIYGQRYGGLLPMALRVDTAGNGVWEPGETMRDVRPSWRNVNGAAQPIGGTLALVSAPGGVVATVDDPTASYGTIGNNSTAEAVDFYQVSNTVTSPRPTAHLDVLTRESITPDTHGQQKDWSLHIGESFTDVPTTNGFYRFIETLLHHGVTGGCSPTQYCPTSSTTRAQMAVFVLVAKEGPTYAPPACSPPNLFLDVPETSPFCRWIEELANRQVVAGCGGGNYCPDDPVTREQMSIFVLRTLDPNLNPPACVPPNIYADVPESSPFCRWIEELTNRQVVTGCGGGNYCPTSPVTREQMGVFISATFGLTLYGP